MNDSTNRITRLNQTKILNRFRGFIEIVLIKGVDNVRLQPSVKARFLFQTVLALLQRQYSSMKEHCQISMEHSKKCRPQVLNLFQSKDHSVELLRASSILQMSCSSRVCVPLLMFHSLQVDSTFLYESICPRWTAELLEEIQNFTKQLLFIPFL